MQRGSVRFVFLRRRSGRAKVGNRPTCPGAGLDAASESYSPLCGAKVAKVGLPHYHTRPAPPTTPLSAAATVVRSLPHYRLAPTPRTPSEVSMEQRRNAKAEETGDLRENPSASGIVRSRFPHAEIRERLHRKSNSVRLAKQRREYARNLTYLRAQQIAYHKGERNWRALWRAPAYRAPYTQNYRMKMASQLVLGYEKSGQTDQTLVRVSCRQAELDPRGRNYNVLAEKQFNVGTPRLVVRSQRDRSTLYLVYDLIQEVSDTSYQIQLWATLTTSRGKHPPVYCGQPSPPPAQTCITLVNGGLPPRTRAGHALPSGLNCSMSFAPDDVHDGGHWWHTLVTKMMTERQEREQPREARRNDRASETKVMSYKTDAMAFKIMAKVQIQGHMTSSNMAAGVARAFGDIQGYIRAFTANSDSENVMAQPPYTLLRHEATEYVFKFATIMGGNPENPMITKLGDTVWHCNSDSIVNIQNAITPLDFHTIKEYLTLSEDCTHDHARMRDYCGATSSDVTGPPLMTSPCLYTKLSAEILHTVRPTVLCTSVSISGGVNTTSPVQVVPGKKKTREFNWDRSVLFRGRRGAALVRVCNRDAALCTRTENTQN
ncbi:hypothetical protein PR048_003400 [Dryococelus australis]|uniref:Uncharacterized protein n=1 Tax=Dryococelus australis TaxID=614101 RepID=A0ABQ9IMV4_9NEOP|nr:hypothetical protein PR048_003400 [Dryococelus australis]